jgi:hypothetical protein
MCILLSSALHQAQVDTHEVGSLPSPDLSMTGCSAPICLPTVLLRACRLLMFSQRRGPPAGFFANHTRALEFKPLVNRLNFPDARAL